MKVVFGGAVLLVLTLTGCGESSPAPSTNAQPPAEQTTASTPTPEENKAPVQVSPLAGKTLSVITTGTASPFSFKDEKGALKGIDIEIVEAVAASEGFKVNFFEKPWQEVLPSIERGEYDIAVNGINYSDERNEKYGLTDPYFYNPSAFMYKIDAASKPAKLTDLKGLTVAVMKDAKQDGEVSAIDGAVPVRETNLFMAYKALATNKVDVVVYDMAVMQSLLKEHRDDSVTVVPYEDKSIKGTNNVFIVNKHHPELLGAFNNGLAKLSASGKLSDIAKKYVGEEIAAQTVDAPKTN